MTKAQIIETILLAERQAWAEYNEAQAQAATGLYGQVANEVEKTARSRWATLFRLMEELKLA